MRAEAPAAVESLRNVLVDYAVFIGSNTEPSLSKIGLLARGMRRLLFDVVNPGTT